MACRFEEAPRVRGMRVTVGVILGHLGADAAIEEMPPTMRFGAWSASDCRMLLEPAAPRCIKPEARRC